MFVGCVFEKKGESNLRFFQKYLRYIGTFNDYSYLLVMLIKKDIKIKYKGSYLGILWSLMNPMFYMLILTLVFSTIFKPSINNFPVYLICGLLLFNFFSSSTNASMRSIVGAAQLIKKIYVPKYIFPMAKVISDFIFFLISLVVLVGLMLITESTITWNVLFAPLYLLLLLIFCIGIGLIVSTIVVFFRDFEHLYSLVVMAMMYSSAIFYPVDIVPERFSFILRFNPMFHFIDGFRTVVYFGEFVSPNNLLTCILISIVSLISGILIFEKNQNKFIFYM